MKGLSAKGADTARCMSTLSWRSYNRPYILSNNVFIFIPSAFSSRSLGTSRSMQERPQAEAITDH